MRDLPIASCEKLLWLCHTCSNQLSVTESGTLECELSEPTSKGQDESSGKESQLRPYSIVDSSPVLLNRRVVTMTSVLEGLGPPKRA